MNIKTNADPSIKALDKIKIVSKKVDNWTIEMTKEERDKSLAIWKEKIKNKEKLEGIHELKTMIAILDSRLKEISELEIKGQLKLEDIIDLI